MRGLGRFGNARHVRVFPRAIPKAPRKVRKAFRAIRDCRPEAREISARFGKISAAFGTRFSAPRRTGETEFFPKIKARGILLAKSAGSGPPGLFR